ncbi:SOS response-associated peptidase [Noviherbaspirillum cavernae]|uniref:Abasic site processing protein n=1 Tax=Noviherbaspirillum cavernae TaxID=2320862 RepID=A0A418WZX2_9BURK|nr:SOS response-associated peptidase [Noviherbaspirillum cavernae]RJG05752.1 SOS response-associated peptidase [Noviherbaspirillum cavernae]
MCGRFVLKHKPATLQEWYQADDLPDFEARYNIAPTTGIVVIRDTPQGRAGSLMRWGLIPSWARDAASLPLLHNARGETVADKPMFRQAFRKRRCLIAASGFYEWKAVPGQKSKQPFYISFKDDTPMSFAGLWESSRTADGEPLDTCTIITTGANHILEPIHHRMPLILERADWDTWLDPGFNNTERLAALVKPFEADKMQAWGVSHAVNRVANDAPALVRPIAESDAAHR